jgi:hypothetical protein
MDTLGQRGHGQRRPERWQANRRAGERHYVPPRIQSDQWNETQGVRMASQMNWSPQDNKYNEAAVKSARQRNK